MQIFETRQRVDASDSIRKHGFAFVPSTTLLKTTLSGDSQWLRFAASWEDLSVDAYMADGGRYRRRRFSTFAVSSLGIHRKPHQPHYQSRDYNPLNGGIERWFEPITDDIMNNPAFNAILRSAHAVFESLTPAAARPINWHVECHQFRIEAQRGIAALPTPEGLHRDGVDWVAVMLIARVNIAEGMTTIFDGLRQPVGNFTLTHPGDCALVDDSRVYHGVTAVQPLDASKVAYRDVLVVTFRR